LQVRVRWVQPGGDAAGARRVMHTRVALPPLYCNPAGSRAGPGRTRPCPWPCSALAGRCRTCSPAKASCT
jgi:hypothetical protein